MPVPRPTIDPNQGEVAFLKEANARKKANDRIINGRNCVADVRRSYKKDTAP